MMIVKAEQYLWLEFIVGGLLVGLMVGFLWLRARFRKAAN
jgi:hypothetical protein